MMGMNLGAPMSGYYASNNMAASLLAQSKFSVWWGVIIWYGHYIRTYLDKSHNSKTY